MASFAPFEAAHHDTDNFYIPAAAFWALSGFPTSLSYRIPELPCSGLHPVALHFAARHLSAVIQIIGGLGPDLSDHGKFFPERPAGISPPAEHQEETRFAKRKGASRAGSIGRICRAGNGPEAER